MITRPKTSPIHRREKPVAVKNKRSAKKIMKSKQDEKLSRKRINPIGVRSKKKPNLDLILSSLSYFLTDMEHRQRANPPSSRRDQRGEGGRVRFIELCRSFLEGEGRGGGRARRRFVPSRGNRMPACRQLIRHTSLEHRRSTGGLLLHFPTPKAPLNADYPPSSFLPL